MGIGRVRLKLNECHEKGNWVNWCARRRGRGGHFKPGPSLANLQCLNTCTTSAGLPIKHLRHITRAPQSLGSPELKGAPRHHGWSARFHAGTSVQRGGGGRFLFDGSKLLPSSKKASRPFPGGSMAVQTWGGAAGVPPSKMHVSRGSLEGLNLALGANGLWASKSLWTVLGPCCHN